MVGAGDAGGGHARFFLSRGARVADGAGVKSPAAKPLVYFILGAPDSGRRVLLADLIEGGLEATDRVVVFLPSTEAASNDDARLPGVQRWTWLDERAISAVLPPDVTHVFLVCDGRGNPVDQAEALKPWVEAQGAEIARVICVVNCQLAERHAPLLAWYEACVHFSDVVLLNRREGVANKWVSGFLTHFKKQYSPCLFEMMKDGRVHNPALILEPQARRMSHAFDEEQDWIFTNADGEKIDEQEETGDDDDEEIEAKPEEDPYFERRNGGRRVREIPDIKRYLE